MRNTNIKFSNNTKNLYAFVISILIVHFQCLNTTSIIQVTPDNLQYSGVFGLGWGVIAIIIALIVGICCCICGSTTLYPGIFVCCGFCLPISVFIIMTMAPLAQPGTVNLKDNPATNGLFIIKWMIFLILVLGLIALLIPFFCLWNSSIIPQRVDSRAQKEYHENYEKVLMEEKQKIEIEKDAKNAMVLNENKPEILLPVKNSSEIKLKNNDQELELINMPQNNPTIKTGLRTLKNLSALRRKKDGKNDVEKLD